MSKSTRALLQIGLALMLASVAGVLIFMWTNKLTNQPQQAAVAPETVPVVVAQVDIHRGAKLKPDMLQVKEFTPDSKPNGSFATIEEIEGRVLSVDVSGNEAVTSMKLADPSIIGGGMSALISQGKRAMSVRGNIVLGLAGFVRPGDRVDVIVTLPHGYDKKPVTKLVLEKVKVLATGKEINPPDEDGMTASVEVYTLELTPNEAERLALAATQGTLNFALRNEQDDEEVLTYGVNERQALAALRPKPKPRRGTRRSAHKVEVITGGDSRTLKF